MPQAQEIYQVGKRQDLSDVMVNVDAKATPLFSMMAKGKGPTATMYEWPHDKNPEPDTTPIPDGKPVDNVEDLTGDRGILRGRVHKLRRVLGVSEFAEDISTPAGVKSEFSKSKVNAMLAVKRGMEAVFGGSQDSFNTGPLHQCRGLFTWIQNTAQADLPVPEAFRTPAGNIWTGTLANLTEDDLRKILQSVYDATGQMLDLDGIVGSNVKARISQMTLYTPDVANKTVVRTFNTKLEDNTLDGRVDVVRGDFGTIRLSLSAYLNWNNQTKQGDKNAGLLLHLPGIKTRTNKAPGFKGLPEDDSGPKGVVTAILGMQVDSPMVHGKILGS